MPSPTHEALLSLFRSRPALAWEVAAAAHPGLPKPSGPVRSLDRGFAELQPAEYAADLVQDCGEGPVLIVEVQLSRDPDKPWVWPRYAIGLACRLQRPVLLLVVTPRVSVGRWARRRVDLGPCCAFQPLVVGPEELLHPAPETIADSPEMAVLAAVMGARAPDAGDRALQALLRLHPLDNADHDVYADLILTALPRDLRARLEELMLQNYPFRSEFAQRFLAQGREEGKVLGKHEGKLEGKIEGKVEGKIEGKIEGKLEGLRQGLRFLLRSRFRADEAALISLLDACPDASLESLGERLADATTLTDTVSTLQSFAGSEPAPSPQTT